MTNLLTYTGASTSVQFTRNPLRGNADQHERFQAIGYTSAGDPYVYTKRLKRAGRTLIYPHQSLSVLSNVQLFYCDRSGSKLLFTWYDHLSVSHIVRFAGDIAFRETAPGQYQIQILLSEDL